MKHLRGIDGLKGLSILAILGYHLFHRWLLGGFVGIEVFFTISGFLAAHSLLRRLNTTGSMKLKQYYLGRFRRIVPPLLFMAFFITAFSWAVDAKDAIVGISRQLLAVVTFSYNWYDIVRGVDYFASSGPELFRHLWFISLLIQFYIVVPGIVWFFWRFWKAPRAAGGLLILAGASALEMGLLFVPSSDPTRVYFGTDTHFFGLLVGVALAFMLQSEESIRTKVGTVATKQVSDKADVFSAHRLRYCLSALLGALATVALVYLTIAVIREDATAFRGGLLLVSLLTALAIVGSITPSSWLGMVLEWRPLAALGRHSYGIFLWHWPLYTLLVYMVPSWRSSPIPYGGFVALALTAVAAWVSHTWVEMPVGDKGFLKAVLPGPRSGWKEWASWTAAILVILLSVAGTARAVLTAPTMSETQALLELNEKHNEDVASQPKAPPKIAKGDAAKNSVPQPAREMPGGDRITAIGDSVMLAAQPALEAQFPGIWVDASVSRAMPVGVGIIQQLSAQRNLREYVVVSLATNSMASTAQLDQLLAACGPGRILVLVNAHGDRSWIPPTNATLAQYVGAHPDQVILVDWDAEATAHESELYSDGIHPTPTGGTQLYASTVYNAISAWVKLH